MRRCQKRERKKSALIDSAASSSFWAPEDEHEPVDEPSNKIVSMADGHQTTTTQKAKLPNEKLNEKARELDLLPGLPNSLLSVGKLADAGYTTIFHPETGGVTVHAPGDIKIEITTTVASL